MNPRCPVHRSPMQVEEVDHSYRQVVWVCRQYKSGCREFAYTGPSDNDIYRMENP